MLQKRINFALALTIRQVPDEGIALYGLRRITAIVLSAKKRCLV